MSVLLRGIQIIPFVENARQAKMYLADNLLRLITHPFQDTLISFCRLIKLIIQFLNIRQSNRRQYQSEQCAGGLADGDSLHKCAAGGSPVSLKSVCESHCPVRAGTSG